MPQAALVITATVLVGMALGLGFYTFVYAKGYSYLTNDPAACANCHVMNEQYDGWLKSLHRSVAVCNDCHVPHDLVGKYYTKARNGFWHSYYFTTQTFQEPIRATPRTRRIAEATCRRCHDAIVAGDGHALARRLRTRSPASAATARWATRSCSRRTSRRGERSWLIGWNRGARWGIATIVTVAALAMVATAAVTALLVNILERKQEAKNPFFRVVRADGRDRGPGDLGQELPAAVRRLPEDRRPAAHQLRRQRGAAAHADRGRPALDRGAVAPRGGPAAQDDVGRLRLRHRLPQEARPRLHARRPDLHRARAAVQAARHLHPLPRVGVRQLQEGGRRRPDQGLRALQPDAVRRGAQGVQAPDRLHRLPRPGDDGAARDAAGLPRGHQGAQGEPGRRRTTTSTRMATRQEMRSFVCGQCHVEYYFKGTEKRLTYPWAKGLRVDQIADYYDEVGFKDWSHADHRRAALKAQHPEFEMWNQGIHARSGVACADCHMPYERVGALKISDHHVRSPLLNVNNACQTCHKWPEEELLARAETIQERTVDLRNRAHGRARGADRRHRGRAQGRGLGRRPRGGAQGAAPRPVLRRLRREPRTRTASTPRRRRPASWATRSTCSARGSCRCGRSSGERRSRQGTGLRRVSRPRRLLRPRQSRRSAVPPPHRGAGQRRSPSPGRRRTPRPSPDARNGHRPCIGLGLDPGGRAGHRPVLLFGVARAVTDFTPRADASAR